ncbi:Uncharacterised protein [Vibrio cholerae]|nr:Uncharacterised protein [Vibrio cholerae]
MFSSLISSMLEITTGVRVDFAFSSSSAKSNSMIVSPIFTDWPSSAIRLKPSPFSSTVSIPK